MAASGALGVAKLLLQFDQVATMGNRQLRVLNPLILSSVASLRACPRLPTQTLGAARRSEGRCGGVSSFGFSGTIAHVVLSRPDAPSSAPPRRCRSRLRQRRARFAWVERTVASPSTRVQSRPTLALFTTCWAAAEPRPRPHPLAAHTAAAARRPIGAGAHAGAPASRPWLLLATHAMAAPGFPICTDASVVDGVGCAAPSVNGVPASSQGSSQPSLWTERHVALLLDGATSASPSHRSALAVVHAVRRFAELDAGQRLLLLAFGTHPVAASGRAPCPRLSRRRRTAAAPGCYTPPARSTRRCECRASTLGTRPACPSRRMP